MFIRFSVAILLVTVSNAHADVFSYEATAFPDEAGWNLLQNYCDPELWVEEGWFHQHVEMCPGDPPPGGQSSVYRRSLEEYIGVETFFLEWVVETDADASELPWGGGAHISAWSNGGVNYLFWIAADLVELDRDNAIPSVFVDIEPGLPHTYRLELYGDELYVWFIDGVVADSGLPQGPYPIFNPNVNVRAKASWLPNSTRWNYVRWGTIAEDEGDYNSDGEVNLYDLYFFQECLTTEAGGWAGCAWADMDFDSDTDCDDWALFLAAWTDAADPPGIPECDCAPADLDCNGSVSAFDLALLLGNWGPCPDPPENCPADLNGDGFVNAFDLAILLGSWG